MKQVPPDVRSCRKLLLAVADLHMRGFQRLRIMPYRGSMGAWHCTLAPASMISRRDGAWLDSFGDEGRLPRYTAATGFTYWEWQAKDSTPPARLARVFLDLFPDVARESFGPDWLYAGWLLYALNLTYPDALPVGDGEGGALGMHDHDGVIPPPPVGFAGESVPPDVEAQEAGNLNDQPRGDHEPMAFDQACNTCAQLYAGHGFCEAFPDEDGIPVKILNGLHKHLEPFPGDRGVRYEYAPDLGPKPDWAP